MIVWLLARRHFRGSWFCAGEGLAVRASLWGRSGGACSVSRSRVLGANECAVASRKNRHAQGMHKGGADAQGRRGFRLISARAARRNVDAVLPFPCLPSVKKNKANSASPDCSLVAPCRVNLIHAMGGHHTGSPKHGVRRMLSCSFRKLSILACIVALASSPLTASTASVSPTHNGTTLAPSTSSASPASTAGPTGATSTPAPTAPGHGTDETTPPLRLSRRSASTASDCPAGSRALVSLCCIGECVLVCSCATPHPLLSVLIKPDHIWCCAGFTSSDDETFCNPCEEGKYKPASGSRSKSLF